jgi:uncharacterized membrane protein YeaQ/YmgE (transglycosylase-associated protein family)
MVMNLLVWVVFGLIAGTMARFILPGKALGQSANVPGFLITSALGMFGSVVGGYLSSWLLGWDVSSFSLLGLAVAVAGALLVLFLYRRVMDTPRVV